ncbi:uncharacterized protein LOC110682275 isoform X1 [Chenopodium quinoa]|uniref:uncharacterized protein LOC110682275 isoform X1 n=1 Tax=Chenopodium quinoa TaxID=63459 RepID=UPI000B7710A1|nr:uncharacterized protein LOC110682275 isoform X1 [Chenopodium quinoa]
MTSNKGKNFLINLSSSSSSDDNGDDDDTASDSASSSSGDECELIDDDDDYEIEDDESEEDDCLKDDFRGTEDDDHCLSNRVIQFLQGRRDLQELSLKACKAYLRRHDLRLSGNKDECIRRVQEHHRIKDGKAEILYPSSSFVINCTGDVCKGDTVLFKQKVYGRSFDKVTRQGKLLGKRTVAGRVVKESYGAAKQQHTFTVEVLWSKGIKKLPSLFPLLVKGRNLYRLKTCRQPWKNEGERRKVLAEKHRRGTAARYKRAKRKNALSTDKGGKSRKVSHRGRSSQLNYPKGGKHFGAEQGDSSSKNHHYTNLQRNVKQGAVVNSNREKNFKPFGDPQKLVSRDNRASTLHSFHGASQSYSESLVGPHRSSPFGLNSAAFLSDIPYHYTRVMPAAQNSDFSHSSFCNSYDIQLPRVNLVDSRQFFPSGATLGQRMIGLVNCSIHGCHEPGSNRCVISACWRCCQRVGMVCNVHR